MQPQDLEVIRICALGLIAVYKQRVVGDAHVAWLWEYSHILNPPTVGSLANKKRRSSRPTANQSLGGWNALAGRLFNDLRCGWVFVWHFGGWTDE